MRWRDHVIAAGLALAVMALSLTVGGADDPSASGVQADRATAAEPVQP
jgi:hypothetical protein